MRFFCLYILFTFGVNQALFSQVKQYGTVSFNGIKQQGAKVFIWGQQDTVLTNAKGHFILPLMNKSEYIIQASFAGYESLPLQLNFSHNTTEVHLKIIASRSLQGVTITGQSQQDIRAEHSIQAEVVDLNSKAASAGSVEQIMNQVPGVRIRNSGGLGGSADVLIGGFSGKSVRFLIDGIPVDYLGSSMGLTKMPTSIASYIEVYKGTLPTEIGVDALGAAVNIVTETPDKNIRHFSYETGSFNTQRLSTQLIFSKSKRFYYGLNAFANYSKNNFRVDNLPIEDLQTGKIRYVTAPLFNNAYRQLSAEVFVQLNHLKWADVFKIKINSFGLEREIQNDFASRARPYGEVMMQEKARLIPSVLHKKRFLNDKLHLSQFLVFSRIENQFTDLLSNGYYDWEGNKHAAVSGSETGTDFTNLTDRTINTQTSNTTYRALLSYFVRNNHKFVLNISNNFLVRSTDNLALFNQKSFSIYNRLILGTGYQYPLFGENSEGLTQLKFLQAQVQDKGASFSLSNIPLAKASGSGFSIAQSVKYKPNSHWLLRASAENTMRLPDQMEVFGDNVFISQNLFIKPEKSLNFNFSANYKSNEQFSIEVSGYYRKIRDMIRIKNLTQFQAQYLNLENVNGSGIELEAKYKPIKNLEIAGNITYNEFRLKKSNDPLSHDLHFINARLYNMPFYFGNAMATYQFDKLFSKTDNLKIYSTYGYVHQFYLDLIEKQFEPDGFLGLFGQSKVYTDRVIPVQSVISAGFTWSLAITDARKISFSAEGNNLLNKPVYNDFKMQNAGRSFYIKFSFTW